MKRNPFLQKSCAIVLALLFTATPVFANTPPVTLNGEALDMQVKMVDGTPYFSLREAWKKIYCSKNESAKVEWYPALNDALLYAGSVPAYRVNAVTKTMQTPPNGELLPIDMISVDGTLMVTPAFTETLGRMSSRTAFVLGEGELQVYQTVYENPTGRSGDQIHLTNLCILDPETGLPDIANVPPLTYRGRDKDSGKDVNQTRFHPEEYVLVTTTEGEKTIFTYHYKKKEGRVVYVVTAIDGYVTHILDQNHTLVYRD